jgi:hypothetical protein
MKTACLKQLSYLLEDRGEKEGSKRRRNKQEQQHLGLYREERVQCEPATLGHDAGGIECQTQKPVSGDFVCLGIRSFDVGGNRRTNLRRHKSNKQIEARGGRKKLNKISGERIVKIL